MHRLSILLSILVCSHAQTCLSVLLTRAEKRALQHQHILAQEIRKRLTAQHDDVSADVSTEELLSEQCHKINLDELKVMSVFIAAYRNNAIDPHAITIAREQAKRISSWQCAALAEFWEKTHAICSLELKRAALFDK